MDVEEFFFEELYIETEYYVGRRERESCLLFNQFYKYLSSSFQLNNAYYEMSEIVFLWWIQLDWKYSSQMFYSS